MVYYARGPAHRRGHRFPVADAAAASVAAGADVAVAAVAVERVRRCAGCSAARARDRAQRLGAALAARFFSPCRWRCCSSRARRPPTWASARSSIRGLCSCSSSWPSTRALRGFGVVPWLGLGLTLFRPDGAFFAAASWPSPPLRRSVPAASVRSLSRPAPRLPSVRRTSSAAGVTSGCPSVAAVREEPRRLRWWVADWIRQYPPWLKSIGVATHMVEEPDRAVLAARGARRAAPAVSVAAKPAHACVRRAPVGGFASLVFLGALSSRFRCRTSFPLPGSRHTAGFYLLAGTAARRVAEAESAGAARRAVCGAHRRSCARRGRRRGRQRSTALRSRSYIDVFPSRLAAILQPGRKIALTDAGRLAYWTSTPTSMCPGLNYAPTALRPASIELLREIDPDLLLIHPGAAIIAEALEPDDGAPRVVGSAAGANHATDLAIPPCGLRGRARRISPDVEYRDDGGGW